jgi:hypothetical protein
MLTDGERFSEWFTGCNKRLLYKSLIHKASWRYEQTNDDLPEFIHELTRLLEDDQKEKLELAREFLKDNTADWTSEKARLKQMTRRRTKRMMEILDDVGEPSLSNIGDKGTLAISVLASHDTPSTLKKVLKKFEDLNRTNREDCRYQSIPAMTDALSIAERKQQRFGTHWFFDKDNYPFLYPVADFEHIEERRKEYGIEPFHWPKSLAMSEEKQLWLKSPLSELVMREPTEEEYRLNKAY